MLKLVCKQKDKLFLRFQPRDQILLCNSRLPCWWTTIQSNMASADTCSSASVAFSEYYADLTSPVKTRYCEKVLTCGFDPYMLKESECSEDLADYPSVEYPDIINYLVLQTSWITRQQMKAYKSMDAYNFFVSGWVNTIFTKPVAGTDKVVVTVRVNHSQRAREFTFICPNTWRGWQGVSWDHHTGCLFAASASWLSFSLPAPSSWHSKGDGFAPHFLHSAFSTFLIFHTPHFVHSSFSTLRIFYTPHFPHSSFSTLCIFYTLHFLHSALRVFHLTVYQTVVQTDQQASFKCIVLLPARAKMGITPT